VNDATIDVIIVDHHHPRRRNYKLWMWHIINPLAVGAGMVSMIILIIAIIKQYYYYQ
jgi:RecJ-like exonuclease